MEAPRKLSTRLIVGIVAMPVIFAWYTLGNGYSLRARVLSFTWLVLSLLMAMSKDGGQTLAIFFVVGLFYAAMKLLVFLGRLAFKQQKEVATKNQTTPPPPGPVQPAPAFSYEDEVQNILNDEFFSEPYTPAEPKATRQGALDRFEESLTTLWAGYIPTVEFTYVSFDGDRSRRQVDVEELVFNDRGQFYLRGYCHKRLEQRTFKVRNIETKLKTGSKRYEFEDWCTEVLGLPVEVIDDIQSLQDA